jgi:hypothetical protein
MRFPCSFSNSIKYKCLYAYGESDTICYNCPKKKEVEENYHKRIEIKTKLLNKIDPEHQMYLLDCVGSLHMNAYGSSEDFLFDHELEIKTIRFVKVKLKYWQRSLKGHEVYDEHIRSLAKIALKEYLVFKDQLDRTPRCP